ncbi:hypothetical protein Q427_15845 [Halomonas sp. BC04]|nr:hypothetical protein Q427_15845 [Halomonas sp. BC04]
MVIQDRGYYTGKIGWQESQIRVRILGSDQALRQQPVLW